MRVHSLAKELEIQTNQLITFLQSKGFDIKGPLNTLGDAEIESARNNLAELKDTEKDKKSKKSSTSGVKKRVFVRSKQTTDPRSGPRRQPGSTQQIRPPQIPQRKQGTSKVAEKAMAHQKAIAEKEKAIRTALDKTAIEAQLAKVQPDASPKDEKSTGRRPERGKAVAADQKTDIRRDQKGRKEHVKTDPGRGKGTERPKKKKFKFSKEDAIRAARDKRRPASQNKPAFKSPVTGSDALGVRKTLCASVMYEPRTSEFLWRYSLACSSDQKKTDFRQKASMIFGSSSVLKSTIGTKTNGFAFGSGTE